MKKGPINQEAWGMAIKLASDYEKGLYIAGGDEREVSLLNNELRVGFR